VKFKLYSVKFQQVSKENSLNFPTIQYFFRTHFPHFFQYSSALRNNKSQQFPLDNPRSLPSPNNKIVFSLRKLLTHASLTRAASVFRKAHSK
jgi:hypothetical protein